MSGGASSASSTASANTMGVYTAAKRSTKRWMGALPACACSTARTMRASSVPAGSAVTRISSSPCWFTLPA